VGQALGQAGRECVRAADRRSVAGNHDLAPAAPLGKGRVREGEPGTRRWQRLDQSGRIDTDESQGDRTLAGREAQTCLENVQRQPPALDLEVQRIARGVTPRGFVSSGLRLGDRQIAVRVHIRALGEGRDLGHVQDVVDHDLRRPDTDTVVVVDREVAQRVGTHHGRQENQADQAERGGKKQAGLA